MVSEPIQIKLPSRPEYCDLIRLAAGGIARKAKFSDDDVEDIIMAVAEAAINVMRHAYDGRAEEMSVTFTLTKDELEVRVEDRGKGFDVDDMMKKAVKMDPHHPRSSGFGILIMKSTMDKVGITSCKDRGSLVTLVKRR